MNNFAKKQAPSKELAKVKEWLSDMNTCEIACHLYALIEDRSEVTITDIGEHIQILGKGRIIRSMACKKGN